MCKLYWTYLWERVNNPVMAHVQNLSKYSQKIVVVGAGIGGLAAALRLSTLGHKVRIIEAAPTPGGKIRTLSGANNPTITAISIGRPRQTNKIISIPLP